MMSLSKYLYKHQQKAINQQKDIKKCLVNMWCGTGKTRTFTISLFINDKPNNVIVFPSLGLINQYCNDYILSRYEPFQSQFAKYKCLAFCSDDESKLKIKTDKIQYTTSEQTLNKFLKKCGQKITVVTYQSFEKFINMCISRNTHIDNLVFDEAHHIVGDKIQNIVFNNDVLDKIVDKTRYYTATPINKNRIIMYDRENPENSDCGQLAYEYLYYQAVEDKICKDFETHISLYRQKPEYSNKYQPIFESIIRACLSGKYKYWNVLTYHSYVNESDKTNEEGSFVKEFASPKNQTLVKKLFTRIQKEEFSHTTSIYSVDKIILKGVHSKTQNRQSIIADFDQKVEGRIYILSSCGILNEGIDTKWANMGVPINPSQSIVKESQRIGRLVRIPEPGMPPATILIPCMVDATKYSSMDTAESKHQMILNELSESGNFKTALNVISAFKYQYDPDLYEMCLKYPNMYAPQEIKDNLKSQGLIVEESKGILVDNIRYICEKENITLDIKEYVCDKEGDILNDIAEQCDKTIEIHTQSYDDTVKYINEDAVDEEPLRLFYCEDDDSYSPITKKDNTSVVKRKSTGLPKKRKSLFDIHTHPDLEVLWKIKEGSIDLNKAFSQGILDVDIKCNEKKWNENFLKLKEYAVNHPECPPSTIDPDPDTKKLGSFLSNNKGNYTGKKNIMKDPEIKSIWEAFMKEFPAYFKTYTEKWMSTLDKAINYIKPNEKWPTSKKKNSKEFIFMSKWLGTQTGAYENKTGRMNNPEIRSKWEEFMSEYGKYKIDNKTKFMRNLDELDNWITINKRLPTESADDKKNKEIYPHSLFYGRSKKHFNNNTGWFIDPEIRSKWEELIQKHSDKMPDSWLDKLHWNQEYIDTKKKPATKHNKDKAVKKYGIWLGNQLRNYHNKVANSDLMKTYLMQWEEFYNKNQEYLTDTPSKIKYWRSMLEKVSIFIETHHRRPKLGGDEKELAKWLCKYTRNQQKNSIWLDKPEIKPKWQAFTKTYDKELNNITTTKKDMSKPVIIPKKSSQEIKQERHVRVKSEISVLHQKYKTMTSQNLNTYFKEDSSKWEEYHKISQFNEESFPNEEIPRNKMIRYLENLPGKKPKIIADLGCGFAEINEHFKSNQRFDFRNFDHHSSSEFVISKDIKNTELDDYSVDIVILSLAMWGPNCKDYLKEAYRILDTGGTLLISEAYKRWNKDLDDKGNPINRLVNLLEENNFTIIEKIENKFMFIECRKN